MSNNKKNQSGFTVVELLLALAIFSFILVAMTVAFSQIIRSYRKGVIAQRTQETSRELIDTLTKEAHRADNVEVNDVGSKRFICFGSTQFEYDASISNRTLKRGTNNPATNCSVSNATVDIIDSDSLQLSQFDVSVVKADSGETLGINVDMIVATKTNDLLNASGTACDGAAPGQHFCATTRIATSIGLR